MQEIKGFNSLLELSDHFKDESVCRKYLEQLVWQGVPRCPYCSCKKVYTFADGVHYKCGSNKCYKQFTVTVGTFFQSTKVPLRKWFHAIYLMGNHKKGISSYQLSRDISVTQKTAWFILSRVREILRGKTNFLLSGVVETDETYVGGKVMNKHAKVREAMKNSKFSPLIKKPVIGMVERGGNVKAIVLNDIKRETVSQVVNKNIAGGSTVVTDSSSIYQYVEFKYQRSIINHEKGEFVRGQVHTNTIEGYFSHLKRTIIGTYHYVSPKHLDKYCAESSFRYNTRKMSLNGRFDLALSQCAGRLRYKDLIAKEGAK